MVMARGFQIVLMRTTSSPDTGRHAADDAGHLLPVEHGPAFAHPRSAGEAFGGCQFSSSSGVDANFKFDEGLPTSSRSRGMSDAAACELDDVALLHLWRRSRPHTTQADRVVPPTEVIKLSDMTTSPPLISPASLLLCSTYARVPRRAWLGQIRLWIPVMDS